MIPWMVLCLAEGGVGRLGDTLDAITQLLPVECGVGLSLLLNT